MARYDERRGYKRHDLRAPVIFAYQDSDQFTKVQMYNYCEDGLCFEARNAIEPGSDIYIMMENFSIIPFVSPVLCRVLAFGTVFSS